MLNLISPAFADAAPAAGESNPLFMILMLVGMFVLFYFLMIRPQQKRAKEHKAMVAAMGKGDEVITSGGIAGRVADVKEGFISVEISEGMVVNVQTQAVVTVLPKGTLKNL